MQKHRGDRSTTSGVNITCVRDLLPFLFNVPVTYVREKQNARLEGFVTGGGYACSCPASACCGYSGEVLSARQFEKHAGAKSNNQNGHILLPNGKSLYDLFHELRDVPAEAFVEEFPAAAEVPITVPAAEASSASQGQQAGAHASWEPNGAQVDGEKAEPPSAPAPWGGDVVMLTEEMASLCLLGLKESSSTTELDTMCAVQGPAAEHIKDEAGGDHVVHDVKVGVTETKYQLDSDLRDVTGMLSTGLLEGLRVTYRKDEVEKVGRINGQGYSCGCSKCNYSSNIMNACEFEKHSGQSSNNWNDHIFLDTGISLFRVVEALKPCKLNMLGDFIEENIGFPPNLDEYNKWKASFQKTKDYLDAVASDGSSTQSSRGSAAGEMIYSFKDHLKDSDNNTISNLNWGASKMRSGRQFKQGGTETSTPTFSGSPDKVVSGLSTGTSEKKGTEEAHSENTGDPLSVDGVKSDSPPLTAVTPNYSKRDSTNLGLPLSSPVKIMQGTLPNCSIDSKSKESKTRENSSTTESDLMCGAEGPAAEQIKDGAGGDLVMHDVKVGVTETKYQLDSDLKNVRGLLATGLLEGFRVTYRKDEVEKVGRINGQGYSCGCSMCNYSSNIMNACEFEKHSGQSSNNRNDHIFLDTGISLFSVAKALKPCKLNMLGDFIEDKISFPPNFNEYNKWKASFQKRKDYFDSVAPDGCSIQSQLHLNYNNAPHANFTLKESASNNISNLSWSESKRRSGRQIRHGGTETSTPTFSGNPDKGVAGLSIGTSEKKGTGETCSENTGDPLSIDGVKSDSPVPTAVTTNCPNHDSTNLGRSLTSPVEIAQGSLPNCCIDSKSKESKTRDSTLHPLIFKEGGLADNTLLTYKLKNGEVLKPGYKWGTGIVCNCCNQEFTPSHFEEHAGMGRRRQPYHNIYTSEGLTLHELALQLQDHLNSNGFNNASVSSFSDYPNLTSSGCGREPSTNSGPIVPLKRTLQERVVKTESCYFCGYGHTTIGNIDPDTIIFCNQCERPCHVKCYNNRVVKKKVPLEILKEYVCFRFLCCQECELLRDRLEEGLEKCEEIAFLRQIRSNICWRLLSGMDSSRDVKLYMPQVIDIFKEAFVESTDEHSDMFSDMVNCKNGDEEKDFRGMYCALLTASTHVVSAAILKVRMEQIAELVLIATRSECRNKGYFILLLKSIEAKLRAWNVRLITVPVDPEMAQIWSEKLGFTILSAEEEESMLESHPLVMFKNLVLVQKSLA